ncbi:hypothetical protein [Thalassotalea atypica]|uniref:hypothetical protein n=1 Tax=Thalassotalea atypica TaxID=2054316 RepID=UPI0025730680|nr:hypothetical protein [Thalassotalea atypica]
MKITSIVFSLLCLATALVSNTIMGAGMWFWVIVIIGIIVFISAFITKLNIVGVILAGLLSIVSVCAVLLGLLAATIGGSFKLGHLEGLLLVLFALVAITGAIIITLNKKRLRSQRMFNA